MSTNDVPGYNPSNNDALAMGSWAEASDSNDKSLIFVQSNEGGRVIFHLFDLATTPITEYREAMPEKDFKATFSFDEKRKDTKVKDRKVPMVKWTWHDKTPFPWDRVIGAGAVSGAQTMGAVDILDRAKRVRESIEKTQGADPIESIARRVAEALGAIGKQVDAKNLDHMVPQTTGADTMARLGRAFAAGMAEFNRGL